MNKLIQDIFKLIEELQQVSFNPPATNITNPTLLALRANRKTQQLSTNPDMNNRIKKLLQLKLAGQRQQQLAQRAMR
jgi:hypothetical protein